MDDVEHSKGYAGMSCSVCAGHDTYNCPCCGVGTRMEDCPECEGTGMVYHAFDIRTRKFVRVTELEFMMLPDDEDVARSLNARCCQGCSEVCHMCDGEGRVPE